jgi:hypothetical protein
MADNLFGDTTWRKFILNDNARKVKEQTLIDLYCIKLFKWFRYVLPLPFRPKNDQLYHLFICSNFEAGINISKEFYRKRTENPKYAPNLSKAYQRFKRSHRDVMFGIKHPRKPLQWKILWKIIKRHEFGMCDHLCPDFVKEERNSYKRIDALNWLESVGYLRKINSENSHWEEHHQKYVLNWNTVSRNLKIDRPSRLIPLEPE